MNLNLILSKIGLTGNLSQNVSLLIILALVAFAFGMLVGKKRLVASLLGIYISSAIVSAIPKKSFFSDNYTLILFLVLIVFFTLSGRKIFDVYASGFGNKLLKVFVFSFLEIVLLLSIIFTIIPQKVALGYVSVSVYEYFVSGWWPLVWVVAPLLFLFMTYRRGGY